MKIKFRSFFIKLTLLFILGKIITLPLSGAFFNDQEVSANNRLESSELNLGFVSPDSDFILSPNGLQPGVEASRSGLIQKLDGLDFIYSQEYVFGSGDSDLCKFLTLKVNYNWFGPSNDLHQDTKYSGLLSDFQLNLSGLDPDMAINNGHDYYPNVHYFENEHWYTYIIGLPTNPDPSLANKTCNFDFKAKAWLKGLGFNKGFYDQKILVNSIKTGSLDTSNASQSGTLSITP
jgi:hypothetical protein